MTLRRHNKAWNLQAIDLQLCTRLMDGSLVFRAAHSWLELREASKNQTLAGTMSRRRQLKSKKHRITACLSKPLTTNRLTICSKSGPLPPTLVSHPPFLPLPNRNNEGKRNINPKRMICKLYLINTFRTVGPWSLKGLIAGWARPHLFVHRGGGGRSPTTQKPWAYFSFSVLQFPPPLAPPTYGLRKERLTCFLHPLHSRWGSGNGRLDLGY